MTRKPNISYRNYSTQAVVEFGMYLTGIYDFDTINQVLVKFLADRDERKFGNRSRKTEPEKEQIENY